MGRKPKPKELGMIEIPITKIKKNVKLLQRDFIFLNHFIMGKDKVQAVRDAGLDINEDGSLMSNQSCWQFAMRVLSNKQAQEYVKKINMQIFENSSKKNLNSFVCSFNNSPHIGRKLLTCALHYYGFFNPETCSKTFTLNPYEIIGTLYDYVGDRASWYKKFFV